MTIPFAQARAAAAPPVAPARGSAEREDKASLTVASPAAVRRLDCRGEDKDRREFLIFPHRTTPPRRPRHARRAIPAFSPLVDPEAERGAGRKGMVMRPHSTMRPPAGRAL